MEMNQIRYFLAVAETLNFTRAAEQCHVAQPSLSKAIRKLEDELGGDLFRREGKATHLSELGREMLPYLRQVYESAEAASALAARLGSAQKATLRIGLSQTIRLEVLAPALAALEQAFDGVELTLERAPAHDLVELLRAGDLDLLVAADLESKWDRLDAWPLFEEAFCLVLPPDLALKGSSDPNGVSDLEEAALIHRPYCETVVERPDDMPETFRREARGHRVVSDEDAIGMARAGLGIALVPESSAQRYAAGELALDQLALAREVRVYGVAGRQRSSAANGMLQILRAADWTVERNGQGAAPDS